MSLLPLRVAVVGFPPEASVCSLNATTFSPTNSCPRPGHGHELLNQIFTLANISYKLVSPSCDVNDYGTLHSNGSWTGLLGGLASDEYDLVSAEYAISDTKLEHFDYSYPLRKSELRYIVARSPEIDVGELMLLVYSVFTWDFYLSFVMMMVLLFAMILTADYLTPIYTPHTIVNRRKKSLRVVVYNDRQRRPCGQKTLIVMASFLLFLVSSLYQACLLAKLLLPKPHGQIFGLKELINRVESREYTFITETASYTYFENVNRSDVWFFKGLRRAFKRNPLVIEPNFTRLMEKLQSGRFVYQARTSAASKLIADHCDLVALDLGQPTVIWQGYAFNRRLRSQPQILDAFNRASIRLQAYARKLEKRYTVGTRNCADEYHQSTLVQQPTVVRPLSLLSLAGMGALLAAGCATATVAFTAEKLGVFRCITYIIQQIRFKTIRLLR